jgi:hypothetical protein
METTDYQPDGSALSLFQSEIKTALENIAALKPEPWHVVSETALVIAHTKGLETKACRDTYRTAFELLSDAGYVVRESNCFRFRKPFTRADAAELLTWSGTYKLERNTHSNKPFGK